MARQAETLRDLAMVRADNRRLLNLVVGTQGTGLGRKNFTAAGDPTGDPCIIVYMPHRIHIDLLNEGLRGPSTLKTSDGAIEAPTDVVVTTLPGIGKAPVTLTPENQALVNKLQWIDGSLDHLPSGAQIGFGEFGPDNDIEGFVGTLGYAVRTIASEGERVVGFLTNQHVASVAGRSLYVPGYNQNAIRVGVTREVREHYPDDKLIEGVNEKFAFIRTDAAFVAAEQDVASFLRNASPTTPPTAIGDPFAVDLDSMDIIGMPVKKIGRTTGLTRGTVVAYGYGVASDNEAIDRAIRKEPANIYTDMLIAPRDGGGPFSAKGDSGSAILVDTDNNDRNRALALLWGGRPTNIGRPSGLEDLTYAIDLKRILRKLELELLPD